MKPCNCGCAPCAEKLKKLEAAKADAKIMADEKNELIAIIEEGREYRLESANTYTGSGAVEFIR